VALIVVAGSVVAATATLSQARPADRFSFVVVGHPRGNSDAELHPRIDELLERIRATKPDLVFITGDMIWGSLPAALADRAAVVGQWERLDAKLATLGVPVHRVPGNHDIHDPITRDVFRERYGSYPRLVEHRNARFYLFNSTFVPTGDDPVPASMKLGKTVRLDSSQVGFLVAELAKRRPGHDFLVMHHVLWWEDDAPWWTEVHPNLATGTVRAVFAGDLGPTMYTHLQRDRVDYFRSIVNADVYNPIAGRPDAAGKLIPSLQFETFLHVTVEGAKVEYRVEPVAALSSTAFLPGRWRDAFGADPAPGRYFDPATFRPEARRGAAGGPRPQPSQPRSVVGRLWDAIGSPRRLAALAAVVGITFGAGVAVGRWRRPG
jgi:hypothetical protein